MLRKVTMKAQNMTSETESSAQEDAAGVAKKAYTSPTFTNLGKIEPFTKGGASAGMEGGMFFS